MCDLRQKNSKWCKKNSAYWLQYESAPGNISVCRSHFAKAYDAMVEFKSPGDTITIKPR